MQSVRELGDDVPSGQETLVSISAGFSSTGTSTAGSSSTILGTAGSSTAISVTAFVRDRLTWAGYLLYGYWSYLWAAFGAFIPYLRSEFSFDYSIASLHFSALAVGPVVAGFCGDKIIRAAGLARTVASGVVLMLMGLVLVVAGPVVACTISGALLIGFGGSIMSQSITTSMSLRFGSQRAIGILEIQTIGTVFTLMAPLAIGAVCKAGFNWRLALISSLAFLALLVFANGRALKSFGPLSGGTAGSRSAGALPPVYWLFFAIIFLSVASEWAVAFWSPEFLSQVLHLSKSDAALGMSVFVLAMLIGRMAGGILVRRIAVGKLLSLSAALAAFGFLLFWLARDLPFNLLGLFIMGLGESNVYPNCLSQALASTHQNAPRAAARMALSTGGATLLAPLLLGLLADRVGIGQAFAFVAVFLIAACLVLSFQRTGTAA